MRGRENTKLFNKCRTSNNKEEAVPEPNELQPIFYIIKLNHPEYERDYDDPDLGPFRECFHPSNASLCIVYGWSTVCLMKASIVSPLLETWGDAYQLKQHLTVRSKF